MVSMRTDRTGVGNVQAGTIVHWAIFPGINGAFIIFHFIADVQRFRYSFLLSSQIANKY